MKKYIFFLVALIGGISVSAQVEFKKLKLGVGIGYAAPVDEQAKGGGLIYLEPAYRLTDLIAVGMRIEAFSADLGSAKLDEPVIGTFSVNGQYYFNKYNLRGFVGGGIGLYKLEGFIKGVESKSKLGFYPRVGFDYGNLNMYVDYNFIPGSKSESVNVKNDYLAIHLGISVGGGRHKGARHRR